VVGCQLSGNVAWWVCSLSRRVSVMYDV